MDALVRDLRFAVRGLSRTPGFTAAAVLALALGIGATTAIFSVVHAVLMRSLGWGEESQLVAVRGNFYSLNLENIVVSPPEYRDLHASPLFETVGAYYPASAALQGERAERVKSAFATGSFFAALGVAPAYGRVFTGEEDLRGNDGVALVSWSAWQKRFGGDPSAVGKTVTLDGRPRTLVGVLPQSFRWEDAEFYLPFGFTPQQAADRDSRYLNPVARLRPGMTLAAARRELDQLSALIRTAWPANYPPEMRWALSLEPLRDYFVGSARQPLLILFGSVLFVLLIACANVANLLLARGAARTREMAVRSALGGSRAKLVLQLLMESSILAAAGAALGVAVAGWGLDALLAAAPAAVQRFADARVSRAVLGFAAAMVLFTTFVFGLVPALQSTRLDLSQSLKEGGHATSGPRTGRLRSGLVIAQVALSLMLLIGAALLFRSFATLLRVPAGFDPEGVVAVKINLSGPAYQKPEAQSGYWAEAVRRASALTGVSAAGGVNLAPLAGRSDSSYFLEGYVRRPGEPTPDAEFRQVTPGYFKALGIAVDHGREFDAGDDAKGAQVVMVNQAWARRYFPGQDVIGKRLDFESDKVPTHWRSIVGVAADAHDFGFDKPTPPVFYVPEAQSPGSGLTLMVRSSGPLAPLFQPLRATLASIDPTQPVDKVDAFESHVEGALAARRFPVQLLGAFAALALALSALGIYGVTAYGVTQRTREIGVRIAVGAQRRDVLRMVMGGAARLAAIGVGVGLFGALLGARLLSSQLYGVSARDPLTYAAISVLLALVALGASLLPALRATRVDPMTALRAE